MCGKPADGFARCKSCRAKVSTAVSAIYKRRIGQGRCRECGAPAFHSEDGRKQVLCEKHRDQRLARDQERRSEAT